MSFLSLVTQRGLAEAEVDGLPRPLPRTYYVLSRCSDKGWGLEEVTNSKVPVLGGLSVTREGRCLNEEPTSSRQVSMG